MQFPGLKPAQPDISIHEYQFLPDISIRALPNTDIWSTEYIRMQTVLQKLNFGIQPNIELFGRNLGNFKNLLLYLTYRFM